MDPTNLPAPVPDGAIPPDSPPPWDRGPEESSKAYAAFVVYRDLGPRRSVSDAYRVHSGREDAIQAAGYFAGWANRFDWKARAEAWDRQIALARAAGAVAEAEKLGADWESRDQVALEQAYELGRKLMQKAELLAEFPVVRKTSRRGKEGEITVLEPIGAANLKAAAATAMQGFRLIMDALHRAIPPEDYLLPIDPETGKPFDPTTCNDRQKIKTFLESGGRRIY